MQVLLPTEVPSQASPHQTARVVNHLQLGIEVAMLSLGTCDMNVLLELPLQRYTWPNMMTTMAHLGKCLSGNRSGLEAGLGYQLQTRSHIKFPGR